jgi:3-hydroxybutyrate dehydrogenase
VIAMREGQVLSRRTAIVTGAGSGIGEAIARELAASGAHVLVQDLRLDSANATADAIRAIGGSAAALAGDAADPAHVREVVDSLIASHGRIDILVNNAGVQYIAPIDDYPLEQWHRLLNILLTAPFLWTQAVLPSMRSQRWGRIVNISSINGKRGDQGKVAYCSAKHGVIGLTRTAALETAADGITVNAICPGAVDTPLLQNQRRELAQVHGMTEETVVDRFFMPTIPQRRLMDASEIATFTRHLCSEEAKGITGQAINVSAGLIMH